MNELINIIPHEIARPKEWLTAREIAVEALPDLPDSERGIQIYAEREGWTNYPGCVRRRKGRGGGLEYNYRLFPTLAQITYVQRYMVTGRVESLLQAEPEIPSAVPLSDRAQRERDARLAVVASVELFLKGLNLSVQGALFVFCDRYNVGMIQVDPWVKETLPSISQRSVFRWRAAKAEGEKDALAVDRSEARKGKGLLETANNGDVRSFVLAWIAANPHLSADIIRGYCEDHFGSELTDRNGEMRPLPPVCA